MSERKDRADAAVQDALNDLEWQMSNFLPAKGENGKECKERRGRQVMREAILAFANDELERAATAASLYIINGNSIHPDIPQSGMNESAKMIAHTTCQHVAEHIREMMEE